MDALSVSNTNTSSSSSSSSEQGQFRPRRGYWLRGGSGLAQEGFEFLSPVRRVLLFLVDARPRQHTRWKQLPDLQSPEMNIFGKYVEDQALSLSLSLYFLFILIHSPQTSTSETNEKRQWFRNTKGTAFTPPLILTYYTHTHTHPNYSQKQIQSTLTQTTSRKTWRSQDVGMFMLSWEM